MRTGVGGELFSSIYVGFGPDSEQNTTPNLFIVEYQTFVFLLSPLSVSILN